MKAYIDGLLNTSKETPCCIEFAGRLKIGIQSIDLLNNREKDTSSIRWINLFVYFYGPILQQVPREQGMGSDMNRFAAVGQWTNKQQDNKKGLIIIQRSILSPSPCCSFN